MCVKILEAQLAELLNAAVQIAAAISQIESFFSKMDAAYQRVVFDELAILGLEHERLKVYFYRGPREERFMDSFADDTISLRHELTDDQTSLGGEFSFTREGDGANMDAYICLGPNVYLFCNNTAKSMQEVTADPRWLDAQSEFLNTSQLFAADPLVV